MDGKIADRSEEITDEEWLEVNEFNREMVQDYLDNQSDLSVRTKPAYRSGLRIFFTWVKDHLKNKDFTEIKKKEFQKYLNWLTNRGLSDSAIKFKKSAVSTFCNYIMLMYEEEYPTFRNFTVGLKVVQTGYIHEKIPLTPDEYINLCKELENREEWQKLAYLVFSYSTGCRRAEARQLLKEVVDYPAKEKKIKILDEDGHEYEAISRQYLTHTIRCKGKSIVGKPRKLKFGEDAMIWMKKWLEIRGDDDCPYMFVIKQKNGETRQVGEGVFNDWCSGLFTEIVGRRVEKKFYCDTDPLLGGKSFSRICRDCARKIALRVDANGIEHEPTKESVQKALYYLNKPFLESVWNSSIQESENIVTGKAKENVWTSYIKNISMVNYIGLGYMDSDIFNKKNTSVNNDVENKPREDLSEDVIEMYKKNKRTVLRFLGYDPFENEPISEQPILYSKLVGYFDESVKDDGLKLEAVIEIVQSFKDVKTINDAKLNGKSDTNHRHQWLYDCKNGGHTIGVSWNGSKMLFYIDGQLIREW